MDNKLHHKSNQRLERQSNIFKISYFLLHKIEFYFNILYKLIHISCKQP